MKSHFYRYSRTSLASRRFAKLSEISTTININVLFPKQSNNPRNAKFDLSVSTAKKRYSLCPIPKNNAVSLSFKEAFDAWLPTHTASQQTLYCYKAAFKHFGTLHNISLNEISIDALQACLDRCPCGRRTKENMKTLCGLIYKYAVPRQLVSSNLVLSQFLVVRSTDSIPRRTGFTKEELSRLEAGIGAIPYADYMVCMCYLGFRPSEALALQISNYNSAEKYFTGGGKTKAGRDRIVPISPRIQPYIDNLIKNRSTGYIFCDPDGKKFDLRRFREVYFSSALKAIGISEKEIANRLLTPHCCRHTFATLQKSVHGSDKDKLSLIGHTSVEMLQHYQDTDIHSLRMITNHL